MVLMNLPAGQHRRPRHKEQTWGHSRGGRGRDHLRTEHWSMYITLCQTDGHWELALWCREELKSSALWQPRGVRWSGRWKEGSRRRGHRSICLSVQLSSVAQSCPALCNPMNHSTPGLPVQHKLPEFIQTHAHRVSDAIQPSHPLSSPSPPAPTPSQHQGLFQWVNSSHEVAKVLELQPSFQWTLRTDLL